MAKCETCFRKDRCLRENAEAEVCPSYIGSFSGISNKEWVCCLTAENFYEVMHWLFFEYGREYIDTRLAVIEWLNKEHMDFFGKKED